MKNKWEILNESEETEEAVEGESDTTEDIDYDAELEALKKNKASYRDWETDRKSTRLNSSHRSLSRMPSSA